MIGPTAVSEPIIVRHIRNRNRKSQTITHGDYWIIVSRKVQFFFLFFYEAALQSLCLLPNIGIDESLLNFSGTISNSVLYANQTPGLHNHFGHNFEIHKKCLQC